MERTSDTGCGMRNDVASKHSFTPGLTEVCTHCHLQTRSSSVVRTTTEITLVSHEGENTKSCEMKERDTANRKISAKFSSVHHEPLSSNSTTFLTSPPCTPFRFSSFPASLPRVNPENNLGNEGNETYGLDESRMPLAETIDTNYDTYRKLSTPNKAKSPCKKLHLPSSFGSCPRPTTIRKTLTLRSVISNEKSSYHLSKQKTMRKKKNPLKYEDFDINTSRDSRNTSMSSLSMETNNSQKRLDVTDKNPNQKLSDSCATSKAVWLSPVLNSECNHHIHPSVTQGEKEEVQTSCIRREQMMDILNTPRDTKFFIDVNNSIGEYGNYELYHHGEKKNPQHFSQEKVYDTEVGGKFDVISPPGCVGNKISGRTRLNFNSLLSPIPSAFVNNYRNRNMGEEETTQFEKLGNQKRRPSTGIKFLHQDFDQGCDKMRIHSFPPTSTQSSFPNNSVIAGSSDDTITIATGALTPFRFGPSRENGIGEKINSQRHSDIMTPQEMHFRFHLDSTQCSPIANVPDDDEVQSEGRKISVSVDDVIPSDSINDKLPLLNKRSEYMEVDIEMNEDVDNVESIDVFKSVELGNSRNDFTNAKNVTKSSSPAVAIESSEHSSLSSLVPESTNTIKTRKNRPMPDMSAFDMGTSATTSSLQNNEFSSAGEQSVAPNARGMFAPIKLLCPPTPVRTPAWAHHGAFSQTDSLITSKVLATCPPQVLGGLSSLEDSLMEDDKSYYGDVEQNPSPLVVSFSAVLEEDEHNESSPDVFVYDNSKSVYDKGITTVKAEISNTKKGLTNSSLSLKTGSLQDIETTINTTYTDIFSYAPNTSWTGKSSHVAVTNKSTGLSIGSGEVGSTISFESDFENMGQLGSGAFADVFKARSRGDNNLYAIKRSKRQFRGKRDRERAMAEVRIMQRLQNDIATYEDYKSFVINKEKTKSNYCLYILCFICAWQEDGHFFCQTELCCRDNCRQMMLSLTVNWKIAKELYPSLLRNLPPTGSSTTLDDISGRLVPDSTIWKLCRNVAAGLFHIHSHGIVHSDIKPLNIFFAPHSRLGALCKIGDFGMAGDIGTVEDGQEGDTAYLPQELLSSPAKHPSGDIFSLGLTLYEVASSGTWELPTEGSRWHTIRNGSHIPELPVTRSKLLVDLIKKMITPNEDKRPTADEILKFNKEISEEGAEYDIFLRDYIRDVQQFDIEQEKLRAQAKEEAYQNRYTPTPFVNRNRKGFANDQAWNVRTPTNYNDIQTNK